jgi:sortase A
LQRIERVLLATGLSLLAVWGAARFHGAVSSKTAIAQFEAAEADHLTNRTSPSLDPAMSRLVDFRLWSPKRVAAYKDSLSKKSDLPLAILRIPKIDLEVPVFNDTDDLTLDRGVGRILGTARVGEPGNLGIAGHRDGFFRGLQSITEGDVVEVVQPRGIDRYVVDEIRIVTPDDTSVLNPKGVPAVTLVTCFPFYFVGHAPKRYIVTALLESARESVFGADKDTISKGKNTTDKENKK